MSKRHRSRKPHRPQISRHALTSLLATCEHYGSITIDGDEGREILKLALSTFNDSGTSGAALDEELCKIDDELRKAGIDPESGAPEGVALLARRCKRLKAKASRRRR